MEKKTGLEQFNYEDLYLRIPQENDCKVLASFFDRQNCNLRLKNMQLSIHANEKTFDLIRKFYNDPGKIVFLDNGRDTPEMVLVLKKDTKLADNCLWPEFPFEINFKRLECGFSDMWEPKINMFLTTDFEIEKPLFSGYIVELDVSGWPTPFAGIRSTPRPICDRRLNVKYSLPLKIRIYEAPEKHQSKLITSH